MTEKRNRDLLQKQSECKDRSKSTGIVGLETNLHRHDRRPSSRRRAEPSSQVAGFNKTNRESQVGWDLEWEEEEETETEAAAMAPSTSAPDWCARAREGRLLL